MRHGRVDLHVHSDQSDGTWSPSEMVAAAKAVGLAAVALTDHDTIEGIPEAMAHGKEVGVEVLPGVELSTELDDAEIHVLGYLFDLSSPLLLSLLTEMREQRMARIEKMVDNLINLGYQISLSEVKEEAGPGAIGRPHIARVLVAHGYVGSVRGAFDRLIGKGKPAYVPRPKLTPVQAITAIRDAGGIPVLAHPGLITGQIPLGQFADAGLMGIEVYYTEHRAEDVNRFLSLAQAYQLVATGGSDCHGPRGKSYTELGEPRVDYQVVEELHRLKSRV